MFTSVIKEGATSSSNHASFHPTVNQSFINKIVAEIEAKQPVIGSIRDNKKTTTSSTNSAKANTNKSDALEQLIDNVADSVVKEVTKEFTSESNKPSRRVTVPKPPRRKKKLEIRMPLLNDRRSKKDHKKTPQVWRDIAKTLISSGEHDLSPEMDRSDEIIDHASIGSATESPPSFTVPTQQSIAHPPKSSFVRYKSRRPDAEQPGRDDIQQLINSKGHLKSKPRLRKKKPMTQRGKKKLTIPASSEGTNMLNVLLDSQRNVLL